MGLWGLGKGLVKTTAGVLTADSDMVISGLKKTAVNAVTTTVQIISQEVWEKAHTDDDED